MKIVCICLLSFALLTACASIQRKEAVEWPEALQYMEAVGDFSMSWRKIDFSGTVSIKMDYPSLFVLEIYGMFGQTIAYIKKEGDNFLLVAGDEKSTEEPIFEEQYGFRIENFMDDLAMKGDRQQMNRSTIIERARYRVIYDYDRKGRNRITWQGPDGTMQLLFTQVSFTPGESSVDNSGRKM